jgi:hypothetical protein
VAPFPYFGGKRLAAPLVWDAIGDVDSYIEPFVGSAAVLLARPVGHRRRVETINDLDGLVTNVWRALAAAPDEVATHVDWPPNELDLHARHRVLLAAREGLTERLRADPEHFDAKLAAWWVWGASLWIGQGWGVKAANQLPAFGTEGKGVQNKNRQAEHGGGGVVSGARGQAPRRPGSLRRLVARAGAVDPRPLPQQPAGNRRHIPRSSVCGGRHALFR